MRRKQIYYYTPTIVDLSLPTIETAIFPHKAWEGYHSKVCLHVPTDWIPQYMLSTYIRSSCAGSMAHLTASAHRPTTTYQSTGWGVGGAPALLVGQRQRNALLPLWRNLLPTLRPLTHIPTTPQELSCKLIGCPERPTRYSALRLHCQIGIPAIETQHTHTWEYSRFVESIIPNLLSCKPKAKK